MRSSDVLFVIRLSDQNADARPISEECGAAFPVQCYQNFGAAEMLPKLLEILPTEDFGCVQFLHNGRVLVSFYENEIRDPFFSEGMRFGDQDIPVTRDGQSVTVVYIRDLPYEVASDDFIAFFSSYGEVLTVERSVAAKFTNL